MSEHNLNPNDMSKSNMDAMETSASQMSSKMSSSPATPPKAEHLEAKHLEAQHTEDVEDEHNGSEEFQLSNPVDAQDNKNNEDLPPLKGRIEAALFVTNKPLSITDLAELLREDMWAVEDALMELMADMTLRPDSAIELDDTDGYILQLRNEYKPLLEEMMPMELSAGAVRVLSAVAIKGPILQSELVETQGSSVYDYIPELLANRLVSKNRVGRSYRLNVTQRFYEYFKLLGDKSELRTMLSLMENQEKRGGFGPAKRLDEDVAHVGTQALQ